MVRLFWVKFLVLQSLTFEVSKVDKLFAICIKGALYDCSHIDPASLHCVHTKCWVDYTAYIVLLKKCSLSRLCLDCVLKKCWVDYTANIVCLKSAGLPTQPTLCCLKSAGLTTQPTLCA